MLIQAETTPSSEGLGKTQGGGVEGRGKGRKTLCALRGSSGVTSLVRSGHENLREGELSWVQRGGGRWREGSGLDGVVLSSGGCSTGGRTVQHAGQAEEAGGEPQGPPAQRAKGKTSNGQPFPLNCDGHRRLCCPTAPTKRGLEAGGWGKTVVAPLVGAKPPPSHAAPMS